MRSKGIIAIAIVLVASARFAKAGGPLVYMDSGAIVKWPTTAGLTSITLTLDRGSLGALSNAQTNAMVANIIGVWNGVPQSTVNLSISPSPLFTDITDANFTPIINAGFPHGYNPVIYDVDGAIIDALFGQGMRNQVLGFAGPIAGGFPDSLAFMEGRAVLNGRMLDGVNTGASNPEVTQVEFEGVIVHEMGHLLGLDHSQINVLDSTNADQPTMFPRFLGGTAMRSLAPDDIAWISYLYPSALYSSSFGTISGQVIERVGATDQGYQGINVIARRVGGGRIDAISCVSGYVFRAGFGSPDLIGRDLIPGMPPGDYTVEIERVYPGFIGGSKVGPLDPPANFPGIAGPEFYNGTLESAYDNPTDRTNLTVAAGNETSNINIILNTQVANATFWLLYR